MVCSAVNKVCLHISSGYMCQVIITECFESKATFNDTHQMEMFADGRNKSWGNLSICV